MAGSEYDRAAYVEFTHQPSIVKAFGLMGATLNNRQIMIQHSSCAIIKPVNNVALFDEAAKLAAAKAIAATVGEGKSADRRRSRSRSRGRRSRSRHRSSSRNYRNRSRDKRRSRSRKTTRRHSRSKSRGRRRHSRSRSRDRRRDGRSRSRRRYRSRSRSARRYSRSRSKGRRDRRDKEKERASDRSGKDKHHEKDKRDRDRDRVRDKEKDRKDDKSRRHRESSPKVTTQSSHTSETNSKHDVTGSRKSGSSAVAEVTEKADPDERTSHTKTLNDNNTCSGDSANENDREKPSLNGISNGSGVKNITPDQCDNAAASSTKPTVVGVKLAGPEDMDNLSPVKTTNDKQPESSGESESSGDAMDMEA